MTESPSGYDDDVRLVRRVLARDPDVLDHFLERMLVVRRVIAARNAQSPHPLAPAVLEDTIQDAYLTLWRRLDSYEGRGPLEAFAYRIASFAWIARNRKHPPPHISLEGGVEAPAPESQGGGDSELEERILLALDALEPDVAQLLRFKHFDGQTFEEIAACTGRPVGSIKTSYYRALRSLRDHLDRAGASTMS